MLLVPWHSGVKLKSSKMASYAGSDYNGAFVFINFIDLLLADIKLPVTEPPVLLPQIFETLDSSVSDLFALIS